MDQSAFRQIAHSTSKSLAIPVSGQDISSRHILKTWLEKAIRELIKGDLDKLMNALYIIDVPEEKAREAFALKNDMEISSHLAELVIQREQAKIKTRKKYGNGNF